VRPETMVLCSSRVPPASCQIAGALPRSPYASRLPVGSEVRQEIVAENGEREVIRAFEISSGAGASGGADVHALDSALQSTAPALTSRTTCASAEY